MKKNILIAGIGIICIVGISLGFIFVPMMLTPQTKPPEEYNGPIFGSPTYDWSTSTPEDQGMNSAYFTEMYNYFFSKQVSVDCILVTRNGFIVEESYLEDGAPREDMNYSISNPRLYNDSGVITQKHGLWSATKTVVSILIGIAKDKGFIDNLNQTFFEFFPERWNSTYDARKLNITIENLLRQESGYLGEFYGIPYHTWGDDYLNRCISMPLWCDPGTPYTNMWAQYSSSGPSLLSAIINKSTGMKTTDFAQEYLFGPLGIPAENYHWREYDGLNTGGSGLYMLPRDMGKLGYLVINNGTWNGTEIVSSEYVDAMMVDYPGVIPLGYLTWINAGDPTFWYASGMYGQKIIMIPEYNIVVVITAIEEDFSESTIVRDYILASII
ncbi:MAG: serine hydrolase domain-containing protein [Promethearchaeota archaeon]